MVGEHPAEIGRAHKSGAQMDFVFAQSENQIVDHARAKFLRGEIHKQGQHKTGLRVDGKAASWREVFLLNGGFDFLGQCAIAGCLVGFSEHHCRARHQTVGVIVIGRGNEIFGCAPHR